MISTNYAVNFVNSNFPKENKILDVGCGGGEFLAQLKKEGFTALFATDMDQYFDPKMNAVEFEKIFLRRFRLVEIKYFLPEFAYSIFMNMKSLWKYLPENIWTAHFIIYVMRKPSETDRDQK